MTVSGDVFCWGSDKLGQLGLGEGMRQMSNFQQTAPRALVAFKQKVIYEIAAGYGHGIARTDINELWSWGLGTRGQLGLGRTSNAELPELAHLEEENQEIYSIACGLCHSAAIIGNGYLYTWGYVCCKLTHSGLTEQLG